MEDHWKIGTDFAIRYGGYKDIQWFKGSEFNQLKQAFTGTLPPIHPVTIALEAFKIVGIYLQWWEMRKQYFLNDAQFEERRLSWVIDIMTQWFTELEQGTVKTDTLSYFERELSHLLSKIDENIKIDVPSSLLLQLNRTADFLVLFNKNIHSIILEYDGQNFTLPNVNQPQPIPYISYYTILDDPDKYANYFDKIEHTLNYLYPAIKLETLLGSVIPFHLLYSIGKNLIERNKKSKSRERRSEFIAIEGLAIELKSSIVLLKVLAGYKPTLKYYSNEDIENNLPGHKLLLSEKSGKY
ncbi:MAG: hypothetical protein AB2L14_12935 [Candidatus Xenobiia bacterium LiM19]